jgi:hypothetical protein
MDRLLISPYKNLKKNKNFKEQKIFYRNPLKIDFETLNFFFMFQKYGIAVKKKKKKVRRDHDNIKKAPRTPRLLSFFHKEIQYINKSKNIQPPRASQHDAITLSSNTIHASHDHDFVSVDGTKKSNSESSSSEKQ